MQDGAVERVKRRLPQLLRVHLAQTFVALDADTLAVGALGQLILLLIAEHPLHVLGNLHAIERRLCDEEVTVLDQRFHVPEEER